MSEIKELLERAGSAAEVDPSPETVDADVRRGRAALARARRRLAIRSSLVGAAAISALLVGSSLLGSDEGSRTPTAGAGQGASAGAGGADSPSDTGEGVRLVAYTEEQLAGFVVDRVPEGWFLQGSSEFSLTVAPEGTDNTHPDNFVGKLVVMLLSQDAPQELPRGERVEVGGRDGVVTRNGPGAVLTYEDGEGHYVQVQSPKVLGWTNEQLARFAEGVEVRANARPGRG